MPPPLQKPARVQEERRAHFIHILFVDGRAWKGHTKQSGWPGKARKGQERPGKATHSLCYSTGPRRCRPDARNGHIIGCGLAGRGYGGRGLGFGPGVVVSDRLRGVHETGTASGCRPTQHACGSDMDSASSKHGGGWWVTGMVVVGWVVGWVVGTTSGSHAHTKFTPKCANVGKIL